MKSHALSWSPRLLTQEDSEQCKNRPNDGVSILHPQPGGQHATVRASECDDGAATSTRCCGLNVVN